MAGSPLACVRACLAATLHQATSGVLERSLRHRELRAPNGFGDELRSVLVSGAVRVQGSRMVACTGRWSLGYCPRFWNVLIPA
jgi:hypothetical protein